jgi:hypothetical protein
MDSEAVHRMMGRVFQEMKAVLERHGGSVEKFIGDAVMGVFGIPRLHEDDALRAVRACHEKTEGIGLISPREGTTVEATPGKQAVCERATPPVVHVRMVRLRLRSRRGCPYKRLTENRQETDTGRASGLTRKPARPTRETCTSSACFAQLYGMESNAGPKVPAGGTLRVVLPADPPDLSPRGARILLEILLEAASKAGVMSASKATITLEEPCEQAAER